MYINWIHLLIYPDSSIDEMFSFLYDPIFEFTKLEAKILSFLISENGDFNVPQLSHSLNVHNPKLYQALNSLHEKYLVQVVESIRPKRFKFTEPEHLRIYLENRLKQEVSSKTKVIESILEICTKQTYVNEPSQLLSLLKGKELERHIISHINSSQKEVRLILGTGFKNIIETIKLPLKSASQFGSRIKIAIPAIKEFEEILRELPDSVKVKKSQLEFNSYITVDNKRLLKIMHNSNGHIGLLTNDDLFVNYIDTCWNNTECCIVPPNKINLSF